MSVQHFLFFKEVFSVLTVSLLENRTGSLFLSFKIVYAFTEHNLQKRGKWEGNKARLQWVLRLDYFYYI